MVSRGPTEFSSEDDWTQFISAFAVEATPVSTFVARSRKVVVQANGEPYCAGQNRVLSSGSWFAAATLPPLVSRISSTSQSSSALPHVRRSPSPGLSRESILFPATSVSPSSTLADQRAVVSAATAYAGAGMSGRIAVVPFRSRESARIVE